MYDDVKLEIVMQKKTMFRKQNTIFLNMCLVSIINYFFQQL
jgi:hypothetical protein